MSSIIQRDLISRNLIDRDFIFRGGSSGDATQSFFDGQFFADRAHTIPFCVNRAQNIFFKALLADFVNPPPEVIDNIELIINGTEFFLDGRVFFGGATWENQVLAPADGSTQANYNVTISGATFSNIKFTFDGGDNFLGTNHPFTNTLHHTVAGNKWFLHFKVTTGPSAPTLNGLFGTAGADGDRGIVIRVDSGGNLKLDHYNGTGHTTKAASTLLVSNTSYNIGVGYDFDTNLVTFVINGAVQTVAANFTAAITGNATYNFCVASRGNSGLRMAANTAMFCAIGVNHVLNATEILALNTWLDARYVPQAAPSTPSKVVGLAIMGSNLGSHWSWARAATPGGDSVTDYSLQYRVKGDIPWITISHAPQTTLLYTQASLTNGVKYQGRVAGINSFGIGPYSDTFEFTANSAQTSPVDLSICKLTVPVTLVGERVGQSYDISPASGADVVWMGRTVADKLTFLCGDGGTTTSAKAFAGRSELRFLTDYPTTQVIRMYHKVSIDNCKVGKKIICGQIHGPSNTDVAAMKLVFYYNGVNRGRLYAICQDKPENQGGTIITTPDFYSTLNIASDPSDMDTYGDMIEISWKYTGPTIEFFLGANALGTVPDYVMTFGTDRSLFVSTQYFKDGLYNQDITYEGFISRYTIHAWQLF